MKTSHGSPVLLPLLAVLASCQSTEARCEDINRQDFMHRVTRNNEEYVLRKIEEMGLAERYALGSPEEQAKIRAQAGDQPSPYRDTTKPRISPPPRPSDVTWYEENCYEGKPR